MVMLLMIIYEYDNDHKMDALIIIIIGNNSYNNINVNLVLSKSG